MGVALIAAPLAIMIGELVSPDISEQGEPSLRAVSDQRWRFLVWIWVGIGAAVLLVPAVLALMRILRGRGAIFGLLGGSLAIVGAIGLAAHNASFLNIEGLADYGDRAAAIGVYEGVETPSLLVLIFFVFLIPFYLGLLLLAAGLLRARTVPWWMPLAIIAAVVLGAAPIPLLAYLGLGLLVVGLGAIGVWVLRTSNAEWDQLV
jgi:hypothetical protein